MEKQGPRKRREKRDRKEDNWLLEILYWIPEILILPFRFVLFIVRSIFRFIFD